MRTLKTRIFTICAAVIISINYQCAAPKQDIVQEEPQLKVYRAYFKEWYAGIDVGGTGINLFFPNVNSDNAVEVDSVFFRRLKGKLVKGRNTYTAILKSDSKYYKHISAVYTPSAELDKQANFPFNLKEHECVISYKRNGVIKYQKITNVVEREGQYYKYGPPVTLNDNDF
jgi:hypothetical protein